MDAQPRTENGHLARWMSERVQRIQALEAENRALREELARMREGIGIALVVDGRVVPVAPTVPGSGVMVTGPLPTVAPHATATQPHPLPRLSGHPATHVTAPQPIPHRPRHEAPRPVYHPLAESSARLQTIVPERPTGSYSATSNVAAAPRPRAGATASPPRAEPRWYEEDAPATREQRALREGNFLL